MRQSKEFQLLNSDDHSRILTKAGVDPADYRPDITHQTLLALLDSPLNKAGRLQVFIHTSKNVLIKVNPSIRIPRTYKRFAGLMVQLLHQMKIKSTDDSQVLMKVVKNPVTDHLPAGAYKIGLSVAGDFVDFGKYITQPELKFTSSNPNEEAVPVVVVIGACAHADPAKELDFLDSCVAISKFHLSAAACCSRVTCAFESMWGVV